jgi:hypothetical protein
VVGAAGGVGVGVTGAAEEAATCFGTGGRSAANVITPAATTATTAANAAVLIFTARKASALTTYVHRVGDTPMRRPPCGRTLIPVLISTSDEVEGWGAGWRSRSGHDDCLIMRGNG